MGAISNTLVEIKYNWMVAVNLVILILKAYFTEDANGSDVKLE